ncbi:MAG: hydroxyphenylacetyl-CoA thioesterase PaaI [candidate division NC10 bacterium]|nr:hydroxyphenylacetyl-CoA thioesterase PaaI [candidate division NC10 bacterium]
MMTAGAKDALFRKISQDPFAGWMGIELQELRPGYSRVAMTLTPQMVNFHGIPHGGAIFSLADAAFAAAGNSHGQAAVALSMTINYLAATSPGARLVAEAQELRKGHRSGFYQIMVRTESGDLVAACQAVVHRKNESLVE